MRLSRSELTQDPLPFGSRRITDKSILTVALIRKFEWCTCFLSLTSILLSNFSPLLAASGFLISSALFGAIRPNRSLRALTSDWLPWMFVGFAFISISWSPVPDLSLRYAVELILTAAAALVMARGMEPASLLSALMCAFIVVDALGLYVDRYALNAGAWAMIGAFGSKNSFSAAQAIFFMTSLWVLFSAQQSLLMRSLALLGVVCCPFLLIAGRSVDAIAPLILATSLTLLAYTTARFPARARLVSLCAGALLIVCIFSVAFVFSDTIIGQLLAMTGKDMTLTGRTYLWERASELISQNPLLGRGYGAFWFQGNPYAEEIWQHFGLIIRGGFNFHNLWYEEGVQLGFVGVFITLLSLLIVSFRAASWVVRFPTAESFFFLSYVMLIDMRSLLETEIFSQFSYSYVIFIAAGLYGRYAPSTAGPSLQQQGAASAPKRDPFFNAVKG
jgi:exopolysaccharide production protein ExoQ